MLLIMKDKRNLDYSSFMCNKQKELYLIFSHARNIYGIQYSRNSKQSS